MSRAVKGRARVARIGRGRADSAPDAVVVGAGHNGLVSANILADAGWDVVVLEATEHLGGAVRSGEVTSPGYVSDLFSAFYPFGAASPVLQALELETHGMQWSHAPSVLAHVFPDDRCAVLSRDVAETAESVSAFAPSDGAAWEHVVGQWERIEDTMLDALFRPFPPVLPVARLARQLHVAGLARLARLAVLPVRRCTEEWFDGDGARMLMAGCAMHADLSPESAGSAIFGWLLTMIGQTHGFPVPRGGAGGLTDALATRLARRGGTMRTASPVERILMNGGRAVGVRLRSGETVWARRAVLADVNAPELYGALVGHDRLPPRFGRDLSQFQWDTPTLKLDWALSAPIPWQAPGAGRAGTVHLDLDMDGMTEFSSSLARRRVPEQPLIILGQMTTADPSRSPAGTESAWGYTHLPIRHPLTEDDIDRHVALVESVVDRHAPGFKARIVSRYVQSPSRLNQENPNLRHGAINGGTTQLHQQLIFRPTIGLGGAATPVDRLFLASASAHPGGGVHGGPGSNAARAALARSGAGGGLSRLATSAAFGRLYRDAPAADADRWPL